MRSLGVTTPDPPSADHPFLLGGEKNVLRGEENILGAKKNVFVGCIASGDQFIAHPDKISELRLGIPDLLCIEMEGAAVAQVCHEYGVPFAVIRTISDKADQS